MVVVVVVDSQTPTLSNEIRDRQNNQCLWWTVVAALVVVVVNSRTRTLSNEFRDRQNNQRPFAKCTFNSFLSLSLILMQH